jgi:hypothetical protein
MLEKLLYYLDTKVVESGVGHKKNQVTAKSLWAEKTNRYELTTL